MSAPMYRLETFGKLALTGGTSGSVSHQRRRLALLALLSASGERGLSRDQILGYLWPDSTTANARHSLEQQLHALRRALGDSLFRGVNPVTLNPDVMSSDIGDFERALAGGELANAVGLYAGPFLEGFYLEEAPEFERWAESERSRLATRYSESLERLANDAARGGNLTEAIRWRRRLVEADPVSSRFALALMRALAASGDRTAALQHARIYEVLVRQELETDPDPSITKYAADLRSGVDEPAQTVPPAAASRHVQTPESPALPVTTGEPAISHRSASQSNVSASGKRRRALWLAGFGSIAAIIVIAAISVAKRGGETALDANRIVVVPFRMTSSDSSVNYLREGVVDLISPMLTGEGGPNAVDSRTAISTWNRITRGRDGTAEDARAVARALGAGLVLSGSLVETRGRLTINGSVTSGNTGDVRQLTPVSGEVDSVNNLLDRFVAQLLARESGVPETSISSLTSHSLPAVRAYLSGRSAHRRADVDGAIGGYARALDLDSTFALAAFELAVSTGKILRTEVCRGEPCRVFSMVPGFSYSDRADDVFDRAIRLAWQNRSKLGKRDLPLLDALHGSEYPRLSSARETLSNLRRAISATPDRPEAQYLLGVLLLYQGPALGMSSSRAEAASAFQYALNLDSSYLAPLARLVDVAAFDGDTAALRQSGSLYLSRDSVGPTADYVRWLVAVSSPAVERSRSPTAGLSSLQLTTLEHIYLTSQMAGIGLEDAERVSELIVEKTNDPLEKSIAYRRAELLLLNRGKPSRATMMLRRMDALRSPASSNFRGFAIAAAMFNDGDRAVADSVSRDLARTLERDTLGVLTRDGIRRTSVALAIQSLWHLEGGDTARAMAAARWIRRHLQGQPRNRVLVALPEMLIASRARRPEGAALRALVDSISQEGCCQIPEFVNLALARAYEESGEEASALRVIRRGPWYYPPRHVSTFLREEGRLAARLGDRAEAIRAYEHFLRLRSDPEPQLRAQRDSIRSEVNRLKR